MKQQGGKTFLESQTAYNPPPPDWTENNHNNKKSAEGTVGSPPQQFCWLKEINCEASSSEKVKERWIYSK